MKKLLFITREILMNKLQTMIICLGLLNATSSNLIGYSNTIATKTTTPQIAVKQPTPKTSSGFFSRLLSPLRTNKKQVVSPKTVQNKSINISTQPKARLTDQQALDALNNLQIPTDTDVTQEFQTLRKENLQKLGAQPAVKTSWFSWRKAKPQQTLAQELDAITINDIDTIDTTSISSDNSFDLASHTINISPIATQVTPTVIDSQTIQTRRSLPQPTKFVSAQEKLQQIKAQAKHEVAQRAAERKQAQQDILKQQDKQNRELIIKNRKNNFIPLTENLATQPL